MPGIPSAEQARKEGVTLKHHPDFLLYMATVSGGYAFRYVMIPCLVDCMRQLSASESVSQACESANNKVKQQLEKLDPQGKGGQLPKVESTLRKKFCIGKQFPPLKQVPSQS